MISLVYTYQYMKEIPLLDATAQSSTGSRLGFRVEISGLAMIPAHVR